jgi:hypothetical protein
MSNDFDLDDVEAHLDEADEDYVRIRKTDWKQVKSAARRRRDEADELSNYRRQDVVRKAGLDGLNERQIAALAREAGDDQSPENLRQIASDFGWATQQAAPSEEEQQEQEQTDREIAQHTEAAAIANGAPAVAHRTVTPEEINGWAPDRLMRLQSTHPDIYELVLREQPVTLPAGFN